MMGLVVFLVMLVVFVIFIVVKGLVIVQQSQEVVVERLGQFHRVLPSGLHVLIPGFDSPRKIEWRYSEYDEAGIIRIKHDWVSRIDLRETLFDFPRQNVITRDNVLLEIDALLYFQVIDSKSVVYEIKNLPEAMEKLAQTSLRSLMGEMELDECLSSREEVNSHLQDTLDDATSRWGVKITRVEVQDINPPEDVRQAMEKEMRAERDRRAEITMAEGHKRAAILKAEGERQSLVIEADGEARARLRVAQAESAAIKHINDALQASGADPSQYLVAMRYIEALEKMVEGKDNKIVYLPYEASGILSSLGGIQEMFKDVKKVNPDS
jgi:regulator of protease activity HflC (stomatin/prohibitin superfamily)